MGETIAVSSTISMPTHHAKLTDVNGLVLGLVLCDRSGKPLDSLQADLAGRTLLQISQGQGGYGDREYPYSAENQSDFGGGRGNKWLDEDSTAYYDGDGADTTTGAILPAPNAELVYNFSEPSFSGSAGYLPVFYGLGPYNFASSFTASKTNTYSWLWSQAYLDTDPANKFGSLTYYVCADNSGSPGTALANCTIDFTNSGQVASGWGKLNTPITLTAGVKYWINFQTFGKPYQMSIPFHNLTGSAIIQKSTGAWSTYASNVCFLFELAASMEGAALFFEHKDQLWLVSNNDANSAPEVFRNGYYGAALSNSGSSGVTATSLDLTGVDLAGKIIKLTAGPGRAEGVNYRTIVGNQQTASAKVYVNPTWNAEQTTATEFAIQTDGWTPVAGHGMTKAVRNIAKHNGNIYFPQGEDTNIRRMHTSAGAPTWADDGTNKTSFMLVVPDTHGSYKIWAVNALSCSASSAAPVGIGANLSFSGSVALGTTDSPVTGVVEYGDPALPWIFKENAFGAISNGVFAPVPVSKMDAARSEANGRALLSDNRYLYFSYRGGSIERYVDGLIDDKGPNGGEGFPYDRRGEIIQLLAYEDRIFAVQDGGYDGYSSLLVLVDGGWCEWYRGEKGKRIRGIYVQSVPGSDVSKLWMVVGNAIYKMIISRNPVKASTRAYRALSSITLSRMRGNNADHNKYYSALKLITDGLVAGHQTISAEYSLDAGETWAAIGVFTTSPSEKMDISATDAAAGKDIQIRLTLNTDDETKAPVVLWLGVETLEYVEPKLSYQFQCVISDNMHGLNGYWESETAQTMLARLAAWADSKTNPRPLTLNHINPLYDGKKMFISSISWRGVSESVDTGSFKYLVSLTLAEK